MASDFKVSAEHVSVLWTTKKQDHHSWGSDSPHFTAGVADCYFQLHHDHGTTYGLYLCASEKPSTQIQVTAFLLKGEDPFLAKKTTIEDYRSTIIWRQTIAEVSKVLPSFQEQAELSFFVDIRTSVRPKLTGHKSVQTPLYLDANFQLEKLSVDFAKLLNGEDSNHDVEVVCGDRTWKVNRSLLGCRSDVFKALLDSDMLEAKTGKVEIRDTEPGLVEEFLQHLHTGRLPELTVEKAMRLYEIGDRYSVAGIKESCATFLIDSLTRDNACTILSLADRHSDQAFRASAITFVLNEKILLYPDLWSGFCKDHSQLAVQIYDQFLQQNISKLI